MKNMRNINMAQKLRANNRTLVLIYPHLKFKATKIQLLHHAKDPVFNLALAGFGTPV